MVKKNAVNAIYHGRFYDISLRINVAKCNKALGMDLILSGI